MLEAKLGGKKVTLVGPETRNKHLLHKKIKYVVTQNGKIGLLSIFMEQKCLKIRKEWTFVFYLFCYYDFIKQNCLLHSLTFITKKIHHCETNTTYFFSQLIFLLIETDNKSGVYS